MKIEHISAEINNAKSRYSGVEQFELLDTYIPTDKSEYIDLLRNKFLEYLKSRLTPHYRELIARALYWFREFLRQKQIKDLNNITTAHLVQFQYFLYKVRGFRELTVRRYMYSIRRYLEWLFLEGVIYTRSWQDLKFVRAPSENHLRRPRRYTLSELLTTWRNTLKSTRYCLGTIEIRMRHLGIFLKFLEENNIHSIYKIKKEHIESFKDYINSYQYAPGLTYSPFIQGEIIYSTVRFIRWLYNEKLIKEDPASGLDIDKYIMELSEKKGYIKARPKQDKILDPLILKFHDWFISKGYTPHTAKDYIRDINRFYKYLKERGIEDIKRVTKHHIIDYQTYLSQKENYNHKRIYPIMIKIRSYFKFLVKYDILNCDPAGSVDLPKRDRGLPTSCMTGREVNLILNLPDTYTLVGIRDRAILETLYSTGVRANELCCVKVNDIDFSGGLLRINVPKGGEAHQRVIPIGKLACFWVKRYIDGVRQNNTSDWLFLSTRGSKMQRQDINCIVKKYAYQVGLRKKITTHSFRVSCATHMLENDADIPYVQQQLGHESIRTTQDYIRLVPKNLKRIHGLCHPREKKLLETKTGIYYNTTNISLNKFV